MRLFGDKFSIPAREEVKKLHLQKFTIDTLGERVFDGYTKDEDWNGWACPYFTFEQAQSIVTAHNDNGWPARYDQGNDQFIFSMKHAGGQEDEIYSPILEDGLKLYPIGTASWIWEEEDKWQ
jgi:hypothetical protein